MENEIVNRPQNNQEVTQSDVQNAIDGIKAAFYEAAHQLGVDPSVIK